MNGLYSELIVFYFVLFRLLLLNFWHSYRRPFQLHTLPGFIAFSAVLLLSLRYSNYAQAFRVGGFTVILPRPTPGITCLKCQRCYKLYAKQSS